MQIKVQFLTSETGLAAQMRVCVSPSKKKKNNNHTALSNPSPQPTLHLYLLGKKADIQRETV